MIQGKIIQGSTPSLSFDIPIAPELVKSVRISFSQRGKNVLVKTTTDYRNEEGGCSVTIFLTQEETFLFNEAKGLITIHLRVMSVGGGVAVADKILLKVEDITDKAVME